jgi:hypothetical protein
VARQQAGEELSQLASAQAAILVIGFIAVAVSRQKEPCQLIALQGIRRFAERRAKPPAFSQVQKRILWASRRDQMQLFEE